MTGIKLWGAFTIASTLLGIPAGVQTVLTPDSLVPLGLMLAAVSGVAVGTWKLAKAVGRLATKQDVDDLKHCISKRLETLEERMDEGGL